MATVAAMVGAIAGSIIIFIIIFVAVVAIVAIGRLMIVGAIVGFDVFKGHVIIYMALEIKIALIGSDEAVKPGLGTGVF